MHLLSRLVATVAAGSLLAAGPTAVAAATTTPTIVRIPVPAGGYQLASSRHAMWAVRADDTNSALIFRIDPATNRATRVGALRFAAGGVTFAFGSLWITDYFGNAVWRVAANGDVQQRIGVGLQPEVVHAAFGSLWVANHHGQSLTRIDPRTDRRVATDNAGDPSTFRSGPQGITAGDGRLFVGSSNLPSLQWIDPSTNVTTTAASTDDAFCGPLDWVGSHVWSPDNCTNTIYQFDADGSVTWTHSYGPTSGSDVPQICGSARLGSALWVAVDAHFDEDTGAGRGAVLEQRDPTTGASLGHIGVGGDASGGLYAGHGSLWLSGKSTSSITRVTP